MEPTEPTAETLAGKSALRVIRVMADSRYVLVAPDEWSKEAVMELVRTLQKWLDSGAQFVVVQGVKLVRLNGPAPEEGTGDDALK
jgi:sensor histidine kinase regulating citrate/malate metabolism